MGLDFSASEGHLYCWDGAGWHFHPRQPSRASQAAQTRFTRASHPASAEDLPHDLARAIVDLQPTQIICTGACYDCPAPPVSGSTTFGAFLSSQIGGLRWAFLSVPHEVDGTGIAAAIADGHCIAVSNGSFKEEHGTAAGTLVDQNNVNIRLTRECIIPGAPSDQSAFRSKVAGLFSICHMVRLLCEYYHTRQGQIQVRCNGQEALFRVFSTTFEPSPRDAHFDLLIATRSAISATNIAWPSRWVKGHQDDDPTCKLDNWARLNIGMDLRAKYFWELTHNGDAPRQLRINREPWPLWIGGNKVCCNLQGQVLDHVHGTAAQQWWLDNKNIPIHLRETIDWKASGSALKQLKRSRQHWIVKHTSGFCSIGHMMAHWKQWPSP